MIINMLMLSMTYLSFGCVTGFEGTWVLTYDPNDYDLDGDCEDDDDDDDNDVEYKGDRNYLLQIDVVGGRSFVSMYPPNDANDQLLMIGTADSKVLSAEYKSGSEYGSSESEYTYEISMNRTGVEGSGEFKIEEELEGSSGYDYYYGEEGGSSNSKYECTVKIEFTSVRVDEDFQ